MSELISFEEYLEKHGSLTYANVGASMLPLLRQDKDLFTVRKKGAERCKVGDVVIYRRPPEQYVLHRIIEVRPDDYVILGDNCITKETGIRDEDILGVLTGFTRGGKKHSVEEAGYRVYSTVIMRTILLRVFLKKTRHRIRRLIR